MDGQSNNDLVEPPADFEATPGQDRLSSGRQGQDETMRTTVPAKKKGRSILPMVVVIAAIGAGGWYGYDWWTNGRFFVSTDDAYVGADISQIAAKVSGYIVAVEVADNAPVKAGQVIARIDDGDYQLALRQARDKIASDDATMTRIDRQIDAGRASVGQAKAQLASAQATAARAIADFDRQYALGAARYASASTVDAARAARDTADAAVRSAEAGEVQAEANVAVLQAQRVEAERARAEDVTAADKAERDLGFTAIRAPFDGVVGTRAVQPGAYVQAGSRVVPLVAAGSLHIDANFKETQLAGVRPGAVAEVSVDAFPDRPLIGRVVSLSPATGAVFSLLPAENATGNFTKIVQRVPVRVVVDDPDHVLRSGFSVVVSVDTRGAP